jgi:hypothetical protein
VKNNSEKVLDPARQTKIVLRSQVSGTKLTDTLTDTLTNPKPMLADIATFCGWQDDGVGGGFALWTLRMDLPGYCKGSTVSARTIGRYLMSLDPKH